MRGRIGLQGVWGTALLFVASPGCTSQDHASDPPNLLVIVSDTLRADVLGCYGGPAVTPNICELAERGVLFERAYSAASRTLPSSVAMFTGKHAPGYARVPQGEGSDPDPHPYFYVPDDEHLLAERLRERGYDTRVDLENKVARQSNNLQGFLPLPEVSAEARYAASKRLGVDNVDARYQRMLGVASYLLQPKRGPFFFLCWIRDPHASYKPPSHLLRQVRAPPGARLSGSVAHYSSLTAKALRARRDRLSPDEIELLRRLYVKEVESVDERVGILLSALDESDLRERTLVFFTSDHGEGFDEHGYILHGDAFYDEMVRVPLIAAGPGLARGLRVREPVAHVDLVPTLAELLGVETPEGVDGASYAALLRGNDPEAEPKRAHYIADAFPGATTTD